jgi:undecaprenyl-diphosphatase
MLLSTGVSVLIKAAVARPRPADELMTVPGVESSFSFPSGHTIGAATLVLVSGYLIWSRHHTGLRLTIWAVASVVVVALVAVSRLYLGYHFVTDVLAAVSLALAVLGVVVAAHRWLVMEGVKETVDA